ncbi:MAG: ABC transporter permease [Ktedonobacteraceae bacterium]|nr:ABC transporter permease [Ktedonobacteraceae bacterium]
MDTKDTNSEFISPETIPPSNTIVPPEFQIQPADALITTLPDAQPDKKAKKPLTPLQESFQRLRRDVRAMTSISVIILFILIAIVGPPIYQRIGSVYQSPINGPVSASVYHGYSHQELSRTDEGPSAQFWLGTDSLGRDMLARLMQGMLISILVAIAVEIIDIILGVTIGVLAGFYGGWLDQFLARFTDLMFAFPGLLFLILLSSTLGPWADDNLSKIPVLGGNGNARLLLISLGLAFTVWPLMARYVRGLTLQLKEQQFIEAARTNGTSNVGIILRHIIPNLFSIVIIASTLNIVNTIVGEAGLSVLNLGVKDPGSSIGLMIAAGTETIDSHPWEILVPTLALAIIVVAFSFLGDGLRDAFDPRSKD